MEPGRGRLVDLLPEQKRALLVGTYKQTTDKETCLDQLAELENLCTTYGLQVIHKITCPLKAYDASTFIGKGKVQELYELALQEKIDVVIFDDEISPQQQRNLEKIFERVTIDRTELILGVFAQRAHTREARIQVDLVTLRYQMPRLRRMWTHLSRQRSGGSSGSGAGGYVKGEGEKQIEIDRRLIRRRLDRLEVELKGVKLARETQRQARKRSAIPTFAIVGYTNVGKSTLMKALTTAEVLVEDKLFATLDTTTRKFILPNRQEILLTDTVGFIRKIPHLLVAAFKSTLEEAVQADILLHLIDASSPSAQMQAESTLAVIKELGAENLPMITVLNKIDQCPNRWMIDRLKLQYPKTVAISALKQEGFDLLQELMIFEIAKLRKLVKLRVPQSHYALVSELLREGKVSSLDYEENDILLEVEIPRILEKKVALFEVSF